MRDYIDAIAVIRNEKSFDNDRFEYIPFDPEERRRIFEAFKSFVAATARGDRRRRIMDASYYNVNDWGILRRLWYYPETAEVRYVCGQEWYSEMAILRDAFDWKKR